MLRLHEFLFTPEDLDQDKVLSKTEQWKRRKRGELKFYKIGRRIFYSDSHIAEFFKRFEISKSGFESETEESSGEKEITLIGNERR